MAVARQHASSIYDPKWAADYLNASQTNGIGCWTPEEVDFADWVFNTAEVLKERAKVRALHEGLTYARAPEERQLYGHKSRLLLNTLTNALSKKLVRKIFNRYDIEIWPWDRAGFQSRS